MIILAIETSCDETAVCFLLVDASTRKFKVLSNILYSQIKEHSAFGGVVPGLASRLHNKKLPGLLAQGFLEAEKKIITQSDPSNQAKILFKIDAIAVTSGPGLEPSLHVGVNQAKMLSVLLYVSLIGVNHMHGHIWSYLVKNNTEGEFYAPSDFPLLALIVSGGHTDFVLVTNFGTYQVLGSTVDDAAGEAFDKVAKMLNLGYPGGPIVSKLAEQGNPQAIPFPRPMIHSDNSNVSFSGLKTAVLYYIKKLGGLERLNSNQINDICASFEQAVVDVILSKIDKILIKYAVKKIVVGGGVSANQKLRIRMRSEIGLKHNIEVIFPSLLLSTDNAFMIAVVAAMKLLNNPDLDEKNSVEVNGNLKI